jgi:hypothetical protein
MKSSHACVEALEAVLYAVDNPAMTYVLPSRLRRAVLELQIYVCASAKCREPKFPINRLPEDVHSKFDERFVSNIMSLHTFSERFKFSSEALQNVASRSYNGILDTVRELIESVNRRSLVA